MYLIIEGNVELSNETGVGETVTIGVLGPKQPFGETTALDGSPSSITAQVIFDEVRVLALQGESLTTGEIVSRDRHRAAACIQCPRSFAGKYAFENGLSWLGR